jgi:hypothetical protein
MRVDKCKNKYCRHTRGLHARLDGGCIETACPCLGYEEWD